jgi:hypothetical protein
MVRDSSSRFAMPAALKGRSYTVLLFLGLALFIGSCKSKAPSAKQIDSVVSFLASDDLKGRDTGSEGIEKATVYLENQLEHYGIQPFFGTYRDRLSNTGTEAYNVVGLLQGTDPVLRNEFILIGAHFDHIGTVPPKDGDGIANGANDNASGTATVLELARYFGGEKRPARSLIFAFFNAEEKGLLGSKHLAETLKGMGINLYAMLNFEMTGVPMKDRGYLLYLTGYDKSNLAAVANAYGGGDLVGLLPKAQEFNLFQRSDNYAFWEVYGVPSHTFSSFDFENYNFYHQPGDEASLMDYQHLEEVVRRMIPVIRGIANGPEAEIKPN